MSAKRGLASYNASYRKWLERTRDAGRPIDASGFKGMIRYEEEKHRRKDFAGRVLLSSQFCIRRAGAGVALGAKWRQKRQALTKKRHQRFKYPLMLRRGTLLFEEVWTAAQTMFALPSRAASASSDS